MRRVSTPPIAAMPRLVEPGVEVLAAAPVGGLGDRRPRRPCRVRRRQRLDILVVGADIADMREGEGDDLASIGRIG